MSDQKNQEENPVETKLEEEIVEIDYKDLYIRELADKQNMLKKNQQDMQSAISFANERIIKELIPLIDTFDIALNYNPQDQGIIMLKEQCMQILKKYGVTEIKPNSGDDFNPYDHEALETQQSEEIEDGKIIKVIQNGYKLHDRLVKAARVIVSKNIETNNKDE